MSCITEILRRKGEKEYLVLDGIAVEDGGTYKGYEYLITFTSRGHRCGYVAIDRTHPCYSEKAVIEDNYPDVEVHGGVTFFNKGAHVISRVLGQHHCDDIWIGFDAMHCDDGKDYDLVRKVFSENNEIVEKINAIEEMDRKFEIIMNEGQYKSKEFMIGQCKEMINQLIEKAAA